MISRLHRISGQLAGIERMIEQDDYCGSVLIQLAAAQKAMQSLSAQILDQHLHACILEQIKDGNGDQAMDEVMELVRKLK